MVESEIHPEKVPIAPVVVLSEIGSGKIRNTALHRIQEALAAAMIGGVLGFAVGLFAGGLLSIVRPGLGVYTLVPVAAFVVVGTGLALRAELKHQMIIYNQ